MAQICNIYIPAAMLQYIRFKQFHSKEFPMTQNKPPDIPSSLQGVTPRRFLQVAQYVEERCKCEEIVHTAATKDTAPSKEKLEYLAA